jgi:zeta-carotene desaturase
MASANDSRPRVVIAGAGIAGLTAALYLLKAGFDVMVVEKSDHEGGKFGATRGRSGAVHEHAYHFLGDWCVNLWSVMTEIGVCREEDCVPSNGVQFLRPRSVGRTLGARLSRLSLESVGARFTEAVGSGVVPPDDMIVWAHSLLDLMAHGRDLDEQEFLNRISVNGFMRSLPYMTDHAALLHQEALLKAFSIPSYETSARSYRRFARLFSRDRDGWILARPVSEKLWPRFLAALQREGGKGGRGAFWPLRRETALEQITVAREGRTGPLVSAICLRSTKTHDHDCLKHGKDFDHLLVTVPFQDLVSIAERSPSLRERAPGLLELRKLRSKQMASLDLYFKRPLDGIPAEHVTLIDDSPFLGRPGGRAAAPATKDADRRATLASSGNRMASRFALSFIDNFQAWHHGKRRTETWLNVVAADFEELAGLPKEAAREAMLGELDRYLEFDRRYLDEERTDLQLNEALPLFMNTVGSWQLRPSAGTYQDPHTRSEIANLFLAGDYCRTVPGQEPVVDVVSLENAVLTARIAARAIATKEGRAERVPRPEVPAEISDAALSQLTAQLDPWLDLATRRVFGPSAAPPGLGEG